jgi:hypothetical protein
MSHAGSHAEIWNRYLRSRILYALRLRYTKRLGPSDVHNYILKEPICPVPIVWRQKQESNRNTGGTSWEVGEDYSEWITGSHGDQDNFCMKEFLNYPVYVFIKIYLCMQLQDVLERINLPTFLTLFKNAICIKTSVCPNITLVGKSVPILKHSHIQYNVSNKRIIGSSRSFIILNFNCVGTTTNSCISGRRNFIIFFYISFIYGRS